MTTEEGTPTVTTTTTYTHTDHLGGTNAVTDNRGNVVETLDYYPYGEVKLDEKAGNYNGSKRKYIGEEYDSVTGLSYLNARYYNGKEGRFLSEDPVFWEVGQTKDGKGVLLNPQAMNSYAYAGGNPIVKKDPDGRNPLIVAGAAAYVAAVAWDRGTDIYQNYQDVHAGNLPAYQLLQTRGENPGMRYFKDANTAALTAMGVVGMGMYFEGLATAGYVTPKGAQVLTATFGGALNAGIGLANGSSKDSSSGKVNPAGVLMDFLGGFIGTRIGQQVPNPSGRPPVSIGASLGGARAVTEQLRVQLGQLAQACGSFLAPLPIQTDKKK